MPVDFCTTALVAGEDFSNCRTQMVDPQNFATIYAGSVGPPAADGTVYPQRINRGVRGVRFGAHLDWANAEDIATLRTNMQAAEGMAQAVRVHLTNSTYDIDVWAIPDYDAGTWLKHGPQSGGQLPDVDFRFVAVAPYTV